VKPTAAIFSLLTALALWLLPLPVLSESGFSDGEAEKFTKDQMEAHCLPSAAVIWVKNGETLFRFAGRDTSCATGSEIHPEKSLIRVGSVSKPFAGLSALALEAEGVLDLDRDINHYLNPPLIPRQFDEVVTARHLLTHTAGFDDFYIGKSARLQDEIPQLGPSVRKFYPGQWIAPGKVSSYSNYGVALLGYVMENAAREPFEAIVERHLFQPLGMKRSTFRQDSMLSEQLVKGWHAGPGGWMEVQADFIHDAPSGQMVTTVSDVEKMMRFFTTRDTAENAETPLRELFSRATALQFTHHPELRGGVGFLWGRGEYAGHRVVSHDGGYAGLACRLMFFEDSGHALFIFASAMNFQFIREITDYLVQSMADAPAPDDRKAASKEDQFQGDAGPETAQFAGYYRNTRYSRNSFTKIGQLMGGTGIGGELRIQTDGSHLLMPDHSGNTRRLLRVDTLLFASLDDPYTLAFGLSGDRPAFAFTSGSTAMERIGFFESTAFQLPFMLTGALLFFLMPLLGMILLISKYRFGRGPGIAAGTAPLYAVSVVFLLQLALLAIGFVSLEPYEFTIGFGYGLPAWFYIANVLPWPALALILFGFYHLIKNNRRPLTLILSLLFLLLSLGYFFSLYYWNMVGWKF